MATKSKKKGAINGRPGAGLSRMPKGFGRGIGVGKKFGSKGASSGRSAGTSESST